MPQGNGDKSLWRPVSDADLQPIDTRPELFGGQDPAAYAQGEAQRSLREKITQGPVAQGQDVMAGLSGASKYPSSEAEAGKQVGRTTAKYAGAVAPLYVPGPGRGALAAQVLKGAAIGGGLGAVERVFTRAGQGQMPDLGGTARAAGSGALVGGVMGPISNIPGVQRLAQRIPVLGRYMPRAVSEAAEAAPMTEAEVQAEAQRQVSERMARGYTPPGQGSDLVDPTTFERGYKPRIVTLEEAARQGGTASAAGGAPAWESQAYTPEAQRLLRKLGGRRP